MIHRRLVLIATLGAALALLPLTGVFAVVLTEVLTRDARTLLANRADAAAATIDVRAGTLHPRETASEAVLDTNTWVFDAAGQVVEQPAGRGPGDAAAAALQRTGRYHEPVTRDGLLLLAAPIGTPAHPAGVVVAGLSEAPYRDARWTALGAAAVLDLAGLAAVALAAARTVSATLAPVAVMTTQAAEWGAHDVHRRFSAGRRDDELANLATTLNGLLARLAASLRHERQLTAEIAHELRTPLARMRAGAETALRCDAPDELRAALADVVTDTSALAEVIDALVHAADRSQLLAVTPVTALLEAALQAVADGPVDLRHHLPQGLPSLGLAQSVALRVLSPVLDNAVRYARSTVTLEARHADASVVITVRDDGPGFTPHELEAVFAPGVRGRAAPLAPDGAGLGLPLARRLARQAGGDVRAHASPDGGLVEVKLPSVG